MSEQSALGVGRAIYLVGRGDDARGGLPRGAPCLLELQADEISMGVGTRAAEGDDEEGEEPA